jgi:hypothetical protein
MDSIILSSPLLPGDQGKCDVRGYLVYIVLQIYTCPAFLFRPPGKRVEAGSLDRNIVGELILLYRAGLRLAIPCPSLIHPLICYLSADQPVDATQQSANSLYRGTVGELILVALRQAAPNGVLPFTYPSAQSVPKIR